MAPQITASHGKGMWIHSTDGQRYMDLTSGIGALSTGHSHPHVVHAVKKQMDHIVHAQQNCVGSHVQLKTLTEKVLTETNLPAGIDSVYFANTGTEAVENAVKIARRHTGKPNIVSFTGGFHGRSMAGMSLSTSKVSCRQGFQPLLAGVYQTAFPSEEHEVDAAKRDLDTLFTRVSAPEDTAAVIVEPVQGEGGIRRVDAGYMAHLRERCDEHGVLLIADEVQAGSGRVGTWWAHEAWGAHVQPDIVVAGKGIASGFPLSATFASERLFRNMHPNSLGGTFNGNAVAAAAANATIDILQETIPTVESKGQRLAHNLRSQSLPLVKDIRQYGLMMAIPLEPERLGRTADEQTAAFSKLIAEASETHGLMVLTAGVEPTVRLLPALTITDEEVDTASERLVSWLGSHA